MKPQEIVIGVAIVTAGVLVAGLLMGMFRNTVPLIGTAHSGFDS